MASSGEREKMSLVESTTKEILEHLKKEEVEIKDDMLDLILDRVTTVVIAGEEDGENGKYLPRVKVGIIVDFLRESRSTGAVEPAEDNPLRSGVRKKGPVIVEEDKGEFDKVPSTSPVTASDPDVSLTEGTSEGKGPKVVGHGKGTDVPSTSVSLKEVGVGAV